MINVTEPITAKQFDTWITALKSGKFKKGVNMLYNDRTDSYCCLGVAAKVLDLDHEPIRGVLFVPNTLMDPVFLTCDVQGTIASKNDLSETFEPVIELLHEMVADGRITFADESE